MIGLKKSSGVFGKLNRKRLKLAVKSGKYIKTKIKGGTDNEGKARYETIAINVNSLAKRLDLSKNDIRMLDQEQLEEVLQNVHDVTAEKDKKVHKFFGKGEKGEKGGVEKVKAKEIANIFMYSKLHLDKLREVPEKWEGGPISQTASSFWEGKNVLLYGDHIVTRSMAGKGSFATVQAVRKLVIGQGLDEWAVKISSMGKTSMETTESRESVVKGFNNLNKLYALAGLDSGGQALEGIQHRPRKLTQNKNQASMEVALYEDNLSNMFENMNLRQKLHGMDQLLKGLAFIQQIKEPDQDENSGAGLVHVDIKLENILVDRNDQGEPILRLADFGGARWASEIEGDKLRAMDHTAEYTPWGELETALEEKVPNVDALHRVATFQMGVTLFKLLTSKASEPYDAAFGYPSVAEGFLREGELEGYPDPIVNFLKSLLHHEPGSRPIGNELRESWEKIVELYGSVQEMAEAVAQVRQQYDSDRGSVF